MNTGIPAQSRGPSEPRTPGQVQLIQDAFARALADIPGLSVREQTALSSDVLNVRRSVLLLGPALTKLATAATPATARALQATENVWRDVEARYGLLTSSEVAGILSAKGNNRAYAAHLRGKRKLIGVHRRNSYLYPGFQFDALTHRIKPVIESLLELSAAVGWDDDELAIWLSSPSGYFGGDRPADHLDDDDLLQKARDEATVEW